MIPDSLSSSVAQVPAEPAFPGRRARGSGTITGYAVWSCRQDGGAVEKKYVLWNATAEWKRGEAAGVDTRPSPQPHRTRLYLRFPNDVTGWVSTRELPTRRVNHRIDVSL